MDLHTTSIGGGTPRVAYLHGLLGQGKNLATIAKMVAETDPGLLYDLPNHGRSPWDDDFGYASMADAVAADLRDRLGRSATVTVVGHSMGGKTAMAMALRHPSLVRGLVVLDIAPDDSSHGYGFHRLIGALKGLDLTAFETRADADAALAEQVREEGVRSFLLQNLHRAPGGGWRWLANLDLLERALPLISGWPAGIRGTYDGPVLWLRGGESGYVTEEHVPTMKALFPRARLVTIKHAGHWLHAEQPQAVGKSLAMFLASLRPELGR